MTTREWGLAYLFAMHWIYIIAISTYLWWGSPRYDRLYLFIMGAMILHWLLLGECLVTIIERQLLGRGDENYLCPSMQFYQGNTPITLWISIAFGAIYLVTIFVVLMRQGYPKFLVWTFAGLFVIYMADFKYKQYKAIGALENFVEEDAFKARV